MTTNTDAPVATPSQAWMDYINPFVSIISKPIEEVNEALKSLVGEPGEQAIVLLKDVNLTPDAAIKSVFQGVPLGVMNLALSKLRAAPVPATPVAYGAADILPEVPNEQSWLTSLRAGGALKVSQTTVTSAIRATMAHRAGLYDVPALLVERIERFADDNAEMVGADFFKLRKQLRKREYADVFEAIDIEGLDGTYVTEARKNELFRRIDGDLWPAIVSFQGTLKGWVDSWQAQSNNPGLMMQNMMAIMSGGIGAVPQAFMMQVPDTGVLRDAADGFNDTINKVFAGTRMPIASALAYEAGQIVKALENPALPGYIGATNRDQMLRMLGVDVAATYPRMETNLIKYVMSVLKIKDIAAGAEEQQFFVALAMLGNSIPWDQLGMGKRTRSDSDRRSMRAS
ncbi:MAG: hypothetical protein KBD06_02995 [Candidatus Pacebacteria bacterium]|nr:hypothetical protein [Candidatus Paceibacterota bacterium]